MIQDITSIPIGVSGSYVNDAQEHEGAGDIEDVDTIHTNGELNMESHKASGLQGEKGSNLSKRGRGRPSKTPKKKSNSDKEAENT